MAALDDVGYRGWTTVEVAGGDRARLAEIARRMDDVLSR
jgi:sugar phosphate isomerase/epimerase